MLTPRTHPHAPDAPRRIREAKQLVETGKRLPPDRQEEQRPRVFCCRTCGHEEMSIVIPRGWYTLSRHTGRPMERALRLGMYCTLECLQEQMPRLIGIAQDRDDCWDDETTLARHTPTPRRDQY